MPENTVGLRYIAKSVGLSISTVSLALRGSTKIAIETRERVLKEAERLGYRPNAKLSKLYRQMRLSGNGETDSFLAVVNIGEEPAGADRWVELRLAMKNRAARFGYRLEDFHLKEGGIEAARLRNILYSRGVSGLIFLNLDRKPVRYPKALSEFSAVCVGAVEGRAFSRVGLDRFEAVFRLLDRIKREGCVRPAFCFEDCSQENDTIYRSAYLGWCDKELKLQGGVPFLSFLELSSSQLADWFVNNRPDALIGIRASQRFHHMCESLRGDGFAVPDRFAIATLEGNWGSSSVLGVQEDLKSTGLRSIDLLVESVESDFETSVYNCNLNIEGMWVNHSRS